MIVDAGRRAAFLYPVRQGHVLDHAAVSVLPGALEAAVSGLDWPEPSGPDDWPWLAAWLRSPRGRSSYVLAGDGRPGDRHRGPRGIARPLRCPDAGW